MDFSDFFGETPTITLRDPLAALLGAPGSGTITYAYADAVKLAGHSCPTVAGAFLMVRSGLRDLHGGEMPERGGVEVFMRDPSDLGTTGVIAAVATLVTGAAPETGFGGFGPRGRFARRGLLHFTAPIGGCMAIRRRDSGRGVVLDFHASRVPALSRAAGALPPGCRRSGGSSREVPFRGAVAGAGFGDADRPCGRPWPRRCQRVEGSGSCAGRGPASSWTRAREPGVKGSIG